MKTNLIKMMMIMAVAMLTFASCSSDDDGEPRLTVPELVQHEQTAENPITLAFSWTQPEGATSFDYELSTMVNGAASVVTSGTTDKTNIEIVSSKALVLNFGTKYTFTLKAKSATAQSDPVSADVTTSEAPFKMEIGSTDIVRG